MPSGDWGQDDNLWESILQGIWGEELPFFYLGDSRAGVAAASLVAINSVEFSLASAHSAACALNAAMSVEVSLAVHAEASEVL